MGAGKGVQSCATAVEAVVDVVVMRGGSSGEGEQS